MMDILSDGYPLTDTRGFPSGAFVRGILQEYPSEKMVSARKRISVRKRVSIRKGYPS